MVVAKAWSFRKIKLCPEADNGALRKQTAKAQKAGEKMWMKWTPNVKSLAKSRRTGVKDQRGATERWHRHENTV